MALQIAIALNVVLVALLIGGLAYAMARPRKLRPHAQRLEEVLARQDGRLGVEEVPLRVRKGLARGNRVGAGADRRVEVGVLQRLDA